MSIEATLCQQYFNGKSFLFQIDKKTDLLVDLILPRLVVTSALNARGGKIGILFVFKIKGTGHLAPYKYCDTV